MELLQLLIHFVATTHDTLLATGMLTVLISLYGGKCGRQLWLLLADGESAVLVLGRYA